MADKNCQIVGCANSARGEQVELHFPLDADQVLSEETVRALLCDEHRDRFSKAGLDRSDLSLAFG